MTTLWLVPQADRYLGQTGRWWSIVASPKRRRMVRAHSFFPYLPHDEWVSRCSEGFEFVPQDLCPWLGRPEKPVRLDARLGRGRLCLSAAWEMWREDDSSPPTPYWMITKPMPLEAGDRGDPAVDPWVGEWPGGPRGSGDVQASCFSVAWVRRHLGVSWRWGFQDLIDIRPAA